MDQTTNQQISAAEIAAYLRTIDPKFKDVADNDLASYANEMLPDFKGKIQLTPAGPPPMASAGSRFIQPIVDAWNPLNIIKGLAQTVTHPIDTYHAITDQMGQQREMAGQHLQDAQHQQGWDKLKSIAAGFGRNLASDVPVFGPMIGNAISQGESGDVAGALGNMTALASQFAIPEAVKLPAIQQAIRGGADTLAGGVVNMGLRPSATLTKNFGNLGRAIIDEDIPLTHGAVDGRYAQVEQNLRAATRDPRVADTPANEMYNGVWDYVTNHGKTASPDVHMFDKQGDLIDLDSKWRSQQRNNPFSAEDLLDVKRSTGDTASWTERGMGNPSQIEQIYNQGASLTSRDLLDKRFTDAGMTDASSQLSREQRLMGIQKALDNADARPSNLRHIMEISAGVGGLATGHPLAGALVPGAMEVASNPFMMGQIGRVVAKTGQAATGNIGANLLRALLMSSHVK